MVAYGPARIREKSATSSPASGPDRPASRPGSRPASGPASGPASRPGLRPVAPWSPGPPPSAGSAAARDTDNRPTREYQAGRPAVSTERPPLTACATGRTMTPLTGLTAIRTRVRMTELPSHRGVEVPMSATEPITGRPSSSATAWSSPWTTRTPCCPGRRPRHRRPDRRGRRRPDRPGRRRRDRRVRRHPDARHDRHAPAHVADRDARVRRRLDAHPVLRLVLPGIRQAVPPRGRVRRQPARPRSRRSTPG